MTVVDFILYIIITYYYTGVSWSMTVVVVVVSSRRRRHRGVGVVRSHFGRDQRRRMIFYPTGLIDGRLCVRSTVFLHSSLWDRIFFFTSSRGNPSIKRDRYTEKNVYYTRAKPINPSAANNNRYLYNIYRLYWYIISVCTYNMCRGRNSF